MLVPKVATRNDNVLLLRVLNTLNEAQARWFVAREVLTRERGGLQAMANLTGMSRTTILKGVRELLSHRKLLPDNRIRRPGAGRKRIEVQNPRVSAELKSITRETKAGDPMSPTKSAERIAQELTRRGHVVSGQTVRRRLAEMASKSRTKR